MFNRLAQKLRQTSWFARPKEQGISLSEMLISMTLAMLVGIAAYQFTMRSHNRNVRAIRTSKVHSEINQLIQRLRIEISNAATFPNASATILGSFPQTNAPNCYDQENYPSLGYLFFPPDQFGTPYPLVPHGLVPLPGKRKEDIDPGSTLTLVDPSRALEANVPDSDGIRVAYLVEDSFPLLLENHISAGSSVIEVKTGQESELQKINAGDYVMLADATKRELIRITAKSGNRLFHDTDQSIWNHPLLNGFQQASAFVHKAQVVTYAHSPTDKTVYRDRHLFDDRFNPVTGTFGSSGQRVPFWEPLARNVTKFRLTYEFIDRNVSQTALATSRTPRAFLPKYPDLPEDPSNPANPPLCLNEIGYPFFRNILMDLEITPPKMAEPVESGERTRPIQISQKMGPVNLRKPIGSVQDETLEFKPEEYFTATPGPTGTPTASPTPMPTALCMPRTPGCFYEPPTPTPTPLPTAPPGGGF